MANGTPDTNPPTAEHELWKKFKKERNQARRFTALKLFFIAIFSPGLVLYVSKNANLALTVLLICSAGSVVTLFRLEIATATEGDRVAAEIKRISSGDRRS